MKDHEKTASTIANEMNDFSYASRENCRKLAETIARTVHRTLQQNMMRVFTEYVKIMAEHPELCDGRNEGTQKLCAKFATVLDGSEALPFI